jgi:hypothetical protein
VYNSLQEAINAKEKLIEEVRWWFLNTKGSTPKGKK